MAFYTSLVLNGFRVEIPPKFTIYRQSCPDNSQVSTIRDQIGEHWFLRWNQGVLWGIPREAKPAMPFGEKVQVTNQDIEGLRLVRARVLEALPQLLNKEILSRDPFVVLGRKNLIDMVCEEMKSVPDIVNKFSVLPKFEFEAKLVELKDGETEVGIFLKAGTRREITAPLSELQGAGINLNGLYVVRRYPIPGEPRLVGKIRNLSSDTVYLEDAFNNIQSISSEEVMLESSTGSFKRCLKHILGSRYEVFGKQLAAKESRNLLGKGFDELLDKCQQKLVGESPFPIGGGILCAVTDRIRIEDTKPAIARQVDPVSYCFDAARTKQNSLPWRGLVTYGPYSRETFPRRSPKIWVLFPETSQGTVEHFIRLLRDGISLPEQSNGRPGVSQYAGGFAQIFGLQRATFDLKPISAFAKRPNELAKLYKAAVEEHLTRAGRELPDCAMVVIPDEFERTSSPDNPYLQAKAIFLMSGVPVQEMRLSTLNQYRNLSNLQYINQNISLALYAKMGGTPWTVNHDLTIADELVIGMGVCELSESRFTERQRLVGITTVFRGDGNYLLGNVSQDCTYNKYPDVLRESTLNILRDIKRRNGWQPGDTIRIVFHIYKPLRNVEVADIIRECVATLESDHNIEFAFLTVSDEHPFYVFNYDQRGIKDRYGNVKAVYTPQRGMTLHLGRYTRLLCTLGPNLIKRDVTPLPQPVLVNLHPQSTYRDLDYLTEQVLKFTALSWRSTQPAAEPVTIYYSALIAELLARLKVIPEWSPSMLNVKLRSSRWFL